MSLVPYPDLHPPGTCPGLLWCWLLTAHTVPLSRGLSVDVRSLFPGRQQSEG